MAKKDITQIALSLISGALVAALGCTYYFITTFRSDLENTYYLLESSSNVAFHDINSDSNAFLQLQNNAIISSVIENRLIDPDYGKKLAALFMTRACINYEKLQNNLEYSEKTCELAKKDYENWKQDDNYKSFKNELVEQRTKIHEIWKSNNALK